MTRLFFIVSSGRSGTAMLTKLLSNEPAVTVEHEYMVHIVQPLAIRRYQGLAGDAEVASVLNTTYGAAAQYCQTALWGDSSNKLSWLIPDLHHQFPQARFVHLARDGRKVTSSYFHKLGTESYDDRSSGILAEFLRTPDSVTMPPPEKKYWWPHPRPGSAWAQEFSAFNQFERIAWHWSEINGVILQELAKLPQDQHLFLKLEDLWASPDKSALLFDFLGLPWKDSHFAVLQRPHNVNRPVDTPLTPEQRTSFFRIAGPMMERLDYADREEYAVTY